MSSWINRLFPPNRSRRLAAKLAWWLFSRPRATLNALRSWPCRRLWGWFRQREYALCEAVLGEAIRWGDPYPAYLRWEAQSVLPGQPGEPSLAASVQVVVRVSRAGLPGLASTLNSVLRQDGIERRVTLLFDPDLTPAEQQDTLQEGGRLGDPGRVEAGPEGLTRPSAWMGCLRAGDTLPAGSLAALVQAAEKDQADIVYGDEDVWEDGERREPFFKPDWSPELFWSMDYIGPFFLARRALLERIPDWAEVIRTGSESELLFLAVAHAPRVAHARRICLSRRDPRRTSSEEGRSVRERAWRSKNPAAEVTPLETAGQFRVRRPVAGRPLVSILLPTALSEPAMLRACLDSIRRRTTYPAVEMVLLDNSRGKAARLSELAGWVGPGPHRILACDEPFNYSRLINRGAEAAQGEYLLLLNDDTEVVTPDWIEALLEHAQDPGVGVAGAKLLYPDGSVQHGGIFLVNQGGGARHAFRRLRRPQNSYHGLLAVARNCAAVTFACALMSRRVFDQLGGLDEQLRIECNDVDFCLRALQAGLRHVWTPFAVLKHRELVSRRVTLLSEDMRHFWRRWRGWVEQGDPYYHPWLSQDADFYTLQDPGTRRDG